MSASHGHSRPVGATRDVRALSLGTPGAFPGHDGTVFRIAAPAARHLLLHLEGRGPVRLERTADGLFEAFVPGVGAGARYQLQVGDAVPMPDPASRFQPEGVHGTSEVIDPRFDWTDAGWSGPDPRTLRIYELHVGTFAPGGTYDAVTSKLPYLADLGINTLELMPLADFPGERNWGYDPGALFAPARCYGRPEALRRLVDEAHRLDLAVLLDVVYNHLGPAGAYLPVFLPSFFSEEREGPWGRAVNLDGDGSAWVRWFILENARSWIRDFHLDGLRLDATHTLADASPHHLLEDLAEGVHDEGRAAGRRAVVIAEDDRNLDRLVRRRDEGGFGLDAVWADDFHHQVRSATAGDNDGYYVDYSGSATDIAATARRGWFFTGQHSRHAGRPRGTDPAGLPPERFVYCLQNHDQVGNRAMGERLHHQVDLPGYLAATMLLLALPETPLLFMGQEWAADTPFQYFTDHGPELGRLVTEGRRREFGAFAAFANPADREAIPDPQAESTFEASRLRWEELEREPHAGVLRFYRAMIGLRANHPLLQPSIAARIEAVGEGSVVVWRGAPDEGGVALAALVCLSGAERVEVPAAVSRAAQLLSTEDPPFLGDARPGSLSPSAAGPGVSAVRFTRPGGVVLLVG
jgi:maltooligosyltrehalose trehalohydrolase